MKYKLYVCDWNPNGCNDLVIYKQGKEIDVLPDALFGIDVNKLGKAQYLDPYDPTPYFQITKKLARQCIAVSPFGVNCPELKKYLK